MSREDYEGLRAMELAWARLQKPLCMVGVLVVWTAVVVALMLMVDVVFAVSGDEFPFCQQRRLPSYNLVASNAGNIEEDAVDAFWLVVFLPSSVVFVFSAIYLFAGISVIYVAPERHSCLKVVEYDCCASKRGSVRCLLTLNLIFMTTFMILSVVLGLFTLGLGTSCAVTLFWCYEVACWGLVILLGATAFVLHRKAAVIIEAGEYYYGHHERGVELLEAIPILPDIEPPILSEDEEENGLDDVWKDDATTPYLKP